MGGFTAQVQSPQTTGGKGNPISDAQLPPANGTSGNVLPRNVSNPGPAGLTILGSNDAMPQGKGAASTNSATSGQPRIGQPNNYANTVGGWDNASIQPQRFGGKGKGS